MPTGVIRQADRVRESLGPHTTCDMIRKVPISIVRDFLKTYAATTAPKRASSFTDDVVDRTLLTHYPSRRELLDKYGK